MKIALPGATIGLVGGGENARMFALAARPMGYRVQVYSPDVDDVARAFCDGGVRRDFDDLISIRQFAAQADVVTVVGEGVPVGAMEAAGEASAVWPSPGAVAAAAAMATPEAVDAAMEFRIAGARGQNGETVFYPPITIDRVNGEMDIARAPSALGLRTAKQAEAAAHEIFEKCGLVGVGSVGFFLTLDHQLVTGAVTAHPDRAGYLTLDACVTSQFEQQVRAVCGLPPGSTDLLRPAATAMLREEVWVGGEPDWAAACALPEVKLHVFGRRGGFLTATATSATLAKRIVSAARTALTRA